MFLYEATVPQLKKMLSNLERWLDAAVEHAQKKSFDPSVFLTARLAPDQYALVRQIQAACDQAKFAVARVTGKEAPRHEDTETTWDEIRKRIQLVKDYLDTYTAKDFEGAEERLVSPQFLGGKALSTSDFLNELALPNFYFHLTSAYSILRHNGVPLGKSVYIGSLNLRDP